MNTPAATPMPSAAPMTNLNTLILALRHRARWKILKALSAGEPLMAAELAKCIGQSTDMTHKHLAALRRAGVVRTRGRLHSIVQAYQPVPGQPIVDFGHCLLRLDQAG